MTMWNDTCIVFNPPSWPWPVWAETAWLLAALVHFCPAWLYFLAQSGFWGSVTSPRTGRVPPGPFGPAEGHCSEWLSVSISFVRADKQFFVPLLGGPNDFRTILDPVFGTKIGRLLGDLGAWAPMEGWGTHKVKIKFSQVNKFKFWSKGHFQGDNNDDLDPANPFDLSTPIFA